MESRFPHIPTGLYAIVDPDQCGGGDPLAYAESLLEAGASILQLRDKRYRADRFLALAGPMASLCKHYQALFVVNDRIDVALRAKAQAVHLGPDDLPVEAATRALGPGVIVGRSTNSAEEAQEAEQAGADYVAFGPLFVTASKSGSRPRQQRSLEDLAQVCKSVRCPVFAIGGVGAKSAPAIARTGAAGVAVIGALSRADNLAVAVRALAAPWAGGAGL